MTMIRGVKAPRRLGVTTTSKLASLGALVLFVACTGPTGPQGPEGPGGPSGPGGGNGGSGPPGCPGLPAGQTVGLSGIIQVSSPPSGGFFATGDRPVLTMKLTNGCGQVLALSDVGTANLYVSGPRSTLQTKAAVKLLNALTDRTAPDRQHHMINLKAPRYADPSQANLSVGNDKTITYQLAAVSDELAGTYTAGIWAVSRDGKDQILERADFQIKTAVVETYASGNPPATTCYDCHLGSKSGKSYQAHIIPGFSPFGNYALDQTPIANCQLCHNNDGYSSTSESTPTGTIFFSNPIVRKVHGAHRGEHQRAAGVAHHEYGLGPDPTLREYLNIGFPSLFAMEKDCQKCHTDDRWKTSPSRLACGTCHDNVFFDTGTLNPPRNFGTPPAGPCVTDADCSAFGTFATCTPTGACQRQTHPPQSNDASCAICHSAGPGLSPIPARHEIYERTRAPGLIMTNYTIVSGDPSRPTIFQVGDIPTATFQITRRDGTLVSTLISDPALSGNLIVAGPTDDRQRIYGSANGAINIKTTGALSYNSATGIYTYVFPGPIPAQALAPVNNPGALPRTNPSGLYTVYLYVLAQFSNPSFRDYGSVVQDFRLRVTGADPPARARQVIANAACSTCHVETVAHGTSRRDPEACGVCHTEGAVDRTVGAVGRTCTVDAQCPGFSVDPALSWESCQAGAPGCAGAACCVMTADPTPNNSIKFSTMIHKVHFARLLEGYAERNFGLNGSGGVYAGFTGLQGKLSYIGFQNTVVRLDEILFPQDIRNCTKCHADSGASCSATLPPCGIGQECKSGRCVNRAWVKPSGSVCLSCHDMDDAYGHAALMTYQAPDGTIIETCGVCHGEQSDFAVEKIHNIWNPYVPPYQRTRE